MDKNNGLRTIAHELGREAADELLDAKTVLRRCCRRTSGELLTACCDCVAESQDHARNAARCWARRRSIHQALRALRFFEWSGVIHDIAGIAHGACELCGGINPKGARLQYMSKSTRELAEKSPGFGHRPDCVYHRFTAP
jgi:hypothetical protein